MIIKSPTELQDAINKLVSGDKRLIYDIARYVTYNYYMYTHIKKDSIEDLENDRIYRKFEKEHNELYNEVERSVDYLFKHINSDLND